MFQPKGIQSLTPIVNIIIDGKRTSLQENEDLLSVTISHDFDAAGMFSIQLNNWDLINHKFTWVDSDLLEIGKSLEIQMGYHKQQLKTLIFGEITGLETEFTQESFPHLVVRGHDFQLNLLRGQKNRTFTKKKDSDIAIDIAREVGLTAQVEASEITREYVWQHNQTDKEFLEERAERIGYEVVVEKDILYFRPLQNTKVLNLKFGENLLDFSTQLSTINQIEEVEVRGYDLKTKKEFIGKANASNETNKMGNSNSGFKAKKKFGKATHRIVNQPVASKEDAEKIAKAKFKKIAGNYITGSGNCLGFPDLSIGKKIEITNIGKRFSGFYYVTSTTHTYSREQGYRTGFSVKRDAT